MKKAKNLKSLIFIVFVSIAGILSANQYENNETFFKEPLTQYVKSCHNSGSFNDGIEFLQDKNNTEFVLKYQPSPRYTIHEVMGAYVGQTLEKNRVNKVIVAPIDIPSQKKFSYGKATLHTCAPGIMVSDAIEIPSNISIRWGLATNENLKSITYHKDLADIVALHLYLNDHDGHDHNLFFDKKTNHFCAIDKGLIFNTIHDLKKYDDESIDNDFYQAYKLNYIFPNEGRNKLMASSACDFLETIDKKDLSSAEIKALKRVSKKLNLFMKEHPPAKLHSKWMQTAEMVGINYPEETKEDISILFEYNHHENKRLVKLIDKLTQ